MRRWVHKYRRYAQAGSKVKKTSLGQEPKLVRIYRVGLDLHRRVACQGKDLLETSCRCEGADGKQIIHNPVPFCDVAVDKLSIGAIDPALLAGEEEEIASYDGSTRDEVPREDVCTKMHVVVTIHAPGAAP